MLIKGWLPLLALIAGVDLVSAGHLAGQTLTTLYQFSGGDGAGPWGALLPSGNMLYGTTQLGGAGSGSIFQINTDGTGFASLYDFSETNADGDQPMNGLILSGGVLYGATPFGGLSNGGVLFAINADGTGFTDLHIFSALPPFTAHGTNNDGREPWAPLVLAGNTLYGVTAYAGPASNGTVFALNTDGTSFTNLHNFTGGADGRGPSGGLVLSGGVLYGTTANGGSADSGTLFRLNTDGTGFTNLFGFPDPTQARYPGGLVLSVDHFYCTGNSGGTTSAVFRLNLDGTGLTNLQNFSPSAGVVSPVIVYGTNLYGTTELGGSFGYGTIFAMNPDGTGFTNLYEFRGGDDGDLPLGGVVATNNTLYGTCNERGMYGDGTIFSFPLAPAGRPMLTIALAGSNVILQWPTNAFTFVLQSTTNIAPLTIWSNVQASPTVLGGQNLVTNAITGTQTFYRLRY